VDSKKVREMQACLGTGVNSKRIVKGRKVIFIILAVRKI
jgi:hypothetical protein